MYFLYFFSLNNPFAKSKVNKELGVLGLQDMMKVGRGT